MLIHKVVVQQHLILQLMGIMLQALLMVLFQQVKRDYVMHLLVALPLHFGTLLHLQLMVF